MTRGLRSRADSLVDVVSVKPPNRNNVLFALDGFLDDFYMAHGDIAFQQGMIDPEPPLTGDPDVDSYIAAAAEHLAMRWGLRVPGWTAQESRMGGPRPQFVPDWPSVKAMNLVESPYAFKRRNIFVCREPLQRARWPKDEPVVEPYGRLQP